MKPSDGQVDLTSVWCIVLLFGVQSFVLRLKSQVPELTEDIFLLLLSRPRVILIRAPLHVNESARFVHPTATPMVKGLSRCIIVHGRLCFFPNKLGQKYALKLPRSSDFHGADSAMVISPGFVCGDEIFS